MKIDVLTLFPEMIERALSYSIPARAQKSKKVTVKAHHLRRWAVDKRGTVDDTPYGGGPGMVLRVDVAHSALEEVDPKHRAYRVILTPDGDQLNQNLAKQLARKKRLVLLCGRYEGFDARIENYVNQKISIGPYVISGGELAALVLIDTICRLIPGVLGNLESLKDESYEDGLSDFPQYTKPPIYDGYRVPEILLSGHHKRIEIWRREHRKPL